MTTCCFGLLKVTKAALVIAVLDSVFSGLAVFFPPEGDYILFRVLHLAGLSFALLAIYGFLNRKHKLIVPALVFWASSMLLDLLLLPLILIGVYKPFGMTGPDEMPDLPGPEWLIMLDMAGFSGLLVSAWLWSIMYRGYKVIRRESQPPVIITSSSNMGISAATARMDNNLEAAMNLEVAMANNSSNSVVLDI